MGNAIADGWSVYSSEDYKTDIIYLEEQDYGEILAEIRDMNLARYHWRDFDGEMASPSDKFNLGLLAEELHGLLGRHLQDILDALASINHL